MESMFENNAQNNKPVGQTVIKYTLKVLGFLVLVAALPLINLYIKSLCPWYIYVIRIASIQLNHL
jgi:hypothetical protein